MYGKGARGGAYIGSGRDGVAARPYGGGGSGGSKVTAGDLTGGDGASGIVIVYEYF